MKLTSSGIEMLALAQQIVRTAEEMRSRRNSPGYLAAISALPWRNPLSYTLFQEDLYPFSQPFSSYFLYCDSSQHRGNVPDAESE